MFFKCFWIESYDTKTKQPQIGDFYLNLRTNPKSIWNVQEISSSIPLHSGFI